MPHDSNLSVAAAASSTSAPSSPSSSSALSSSANHKMITTCHDPLLMPQQHSDGASLSSSPSSSDNNNNVLHHTVNSPNSITLSLLTFNILAPCYKKIPHPHPEMSHRRYHNDGTTSEIVSDSMPQSRRDEMNKFIMDLSMNDTDSSSHHSSGTKKRIIYTLESNSRPTYQYRINMTFDLLGRMAKDANYSVRKYLRDLEIADSHGGIEEIVEDSLSPLSPHAKTFSSDFTAPMPINLIFLQEFWFGEGGSSANKRFIASPRASRNIHVTKNERIRMSTYFHQLFQRYLGDYFIFGTQRVKGKMDGVLICFNGGDGSHQKGGERNGPESIQHAQGENKKRKQQSSKRKTKSHSKASDASTSSASTFSHNPNSEWKLVETRSIRLLGVSNRVASLCHLRSTEKFTLDTSKQECSDGNSPCAGDSSSANATSKIYHEHIHVVAVCTHLTFPHDEHDEHYLRVLQTTSMLEAVEQCWQEFDPLNQIHRAYKFSIFGGDLNVSAKFFNNSIQEDPVLSLLLKKGYKSIYSAVNFVSHLNHNGENAPADYLFINRNVRVNKSFLVPQEKSCNEWDEEWSIFSDHRPLFACIEMDPQTSCCPFLNEFTVQS